MIELVNFEKWIKAAHSIFEIFEGRFDAYPISRRWIEEWYTGGYFDITKSDIARLNKLKENFDYSAFGINDINFQERVNSQFYKLIEILNKNKIYRNIGFGVAPYLFTWNFKRFKKYFEIRNNFDLIQYFQDLGSFFNNLKSKLKNFSKKKIYSCKIDEEGARRIFNEVNKKLKALGIKRNEPVGVAKLLHIFAPYYFPLIDNSIAEAIGLKQQRKSLNVDKYIQWMRSLKNWIGSYNEEKIREIENQYGESILKLIDEGLYIMSSVNLSLRIKLMGLDIESYGR